MMSTSFKLLVATSKTPLLHSSYKKLMLMPIKKSLDGCQQMPEKTTPLSQPNSGRNWTEEQKIYSFTKRLRTDLSYALWPLLALKDNPIMNMAIELAQQIEDNQRIHLGSTLPVFAPVFVMAPTPQMTATSFAVQTQNPNE
ncbi:hypothetical protein G9A89_010958 [Geosiphon pyriformis]|nr:hypothetical protein G9A89_010958 [Geosiphon pyriformis]